jgi:hypothetical protein
VRRDTARLGDDHAALDILFLDPALRLTLTVLRKRGLRRREKQPKNRCNHGKPSHFSFSPQESTKCRSGTADTPGAPIA